MVIRILDIVDGADTADQGDLVLSALMPVLASDRQVTLSFDGVQTATSSFVNACFIPLLRDLGIQAFKDRVHVVKSNYQINGMIRRRLSREAEYHYAAA